MKKILTLITFALAGINFANAQECDLPEPFTGNTGVNMTVMLTPGFMSSLPGDDANSYMVALNAEGVVVGSADIGGMAQNSLAIWGDDTQTPEVDGALANEAITFQLVDGSDLYDVDMPAPVVFVVNAMSFQTSAGTSTLVDCSSVSDGACDLPEYFTGNTGVNMTVMLTSGFMSSLPGDDANSYMVALNAEGVVVGSADIGGLSQNSISVWGDDTQTPEVDGALASEAITFQLIDGSNLYDVVMPDPVTFTANGMSAQTIAATTSLVDCSGGGVDVVEGCTDETAFNYNPDANTDDGSCEAVVEGCTNPLAFNYNPDANTNDGSCEPVVEGCMDETASNYNADANVDNGSCQFGVPISYQLSSGWNMVGYTGTAENNGIVNQMDAALGNGAGTANTFQVIKNVSGAFWSAAFAQINEFTQGEGYMMFVNGDVTTVNFQQTSGYISGITYQLSSGWNMVAFTGDVDADNNIVSSMDAALGNGAGTANTFQVIKNVSGAFWSAAFAQINEFTPGEAYMMFVNGDATTVNFQQ